MCTYIYIYAYRHMLYTSLYATQSIREYPKVYPKVPGGIQNNLKIMMGRQEMRMFNRTIINHHQSPMLFTLQETTAIWPLRSWTAGRDLNCCWPKHAKTIGVDEKIHKCYDGGALTLSAKARSVDGARTHPYPARCTGSQQPQILLGAQKSNMESPKKKVS